MWETLIHDQWQLENAPPPTDFEWEVLKATTRFRFASTELERRYWQARESYYRHLQYLKENQLPPDPQRARWRIKVDRLEAELQHRTCASWAVPGYKGEIPYELSTILTHH